MRREIPHILFNPTEKGHLDFELVSITELIENTKDFEHSPEDTHILQFYMLVFFTKGTSEHFIDFKWHPVKKNSLLFSSKGQVNSFKFTKDTEGFCVFFNEDFFVKSLSHLPEEFALRQFNSQLFSPIVQLPEASEFEHYFGLLKDEYNKINSFNQKTILESLFIILLSKTEPLKQSDPVKNIESTKTVIFQKFTYLISINFEKSRSAEFYATELNITYKHLNSICKNLINKTAKNVIDDFIILKAKRKLLNSNIKSAQLAYKLGFEQPTNFTQYFKKQTGLTPKAFKSKFLKD